MHNEWFMIHDAWCMMHDGAFQYISYIYRVSAPSIPKISVLPVLEPTEKISNTDTYIHTSANTPHYYIDCTVLVKSITTFCTVPCLSSFSWLSQPLPQSCHSDYLTLPLFPSSTSYNIEVKIIQIKTSSLHSIVISLEVHSLSVHIAQERVIKGLFIFCKKIKSRNLHMMRSWYGLVWVDAG